MANGLAFDRASVRTYDGNGRLHVELANISKANICPYLGREIPGHADLGLQPDRIYRLFRDPDELEKAAPTFNRVQLLQRHIPVSADDHQPYDVVGTTGSEAEFDGTYLKNSLTVWASSAIADIEDDTKKELSSAYHYRADMTPGSYQGEDYDGVMRDIVGNHVALVKEGRAGSDVVVGDSKENITMKTAVLSRKGALLQGALAVYLAPKMAQDAKIDLTSALKDVQTKTYKASKPMLLQAVTAATKGKLAQDADLDDLVNLLDSLDTIEPAESPDPAVVMKPPEPSDDTTNDAAPLDRIKAFLKGKISDEDIDKLDAMMAADPDADTSPALVGDADPKPKDSKDVVTKPAMDAAIAAAVRQAEKAAAERQSGIRDAERAVRPYVGDLAMAHDSAEAVYRTAFSSLGVDVTGVHASAFPTILKLQPLPDARAARKAAPAMDAAAASSFATRFPEAARLDI